MKKQTEIVMKRRKSKEIIAPLLPPKFVLFCFVVLKIFSTLRLCSGVPQGPEMEPLVFFKPGPLSAPQMKYVTRRGNVSDGNNLCYRQNWPRPLRSSSQPWVESLYPLIQGCVLLHTHKYTEWIRAPTRAPVKREDILCVCTSAEHT